MYTGICEICAVGGPVRPNETVAIGLSYGKDMNMVKIVTIVAWKLDKSFCMNENIQCVALVRFPTQPIRLGVTVVYHSPTCGPSMLVVTVLLKFAIELINMLNIAIRCSVFFRKICLMFSVQCYFTILKANINAFANPFLNQSRTKKRPGASGQQWWMVDISHRSIVGRVRA